MSKSKKPSPGALAPVTGSAARADIARLRSNGYVFEYNPETRYVQARHPLGGRYSLCEVVCPCSFEDTDQMGHAIALALTQLNAQPNTKLSHPASEPSTNETDV